MKLVEWLSADFQVILQHVQSGELIDDRVYRRLKNTKVKEAEDACIDLIDILMSRGEGPSSAFIKLLKDPEIHVTYPQLKDWILSLGLSGNKVDIFVLSGLTACLHHLFHPCESQFK